MMVLKKMMVFGIMVALTALFFVGEQEAGPGTCKKCGN